MPLAQCSSGNPDETLATQLFENATQKLGGNHQ